MKKEPWKIYWIKRKDQITIIKPKEMQPEQINEQTILLVPMKVAIVKTKAWR